MKRPRRDYVAHEMSRTMALVVTESTACRGGEGRGGRGLAVIGRRMQIHRAACARAISLPSRPLFAVKTRRGSFVGNTHSQKTVCA